MGYRIAILSHLTHDISLSTDAHVWRRLFKTDKELGLGNFYYFVVGNFTKRRDFFKECENAYVLYEEMFDNGHRGDVCIDPKVVKTLFDDLCIDAIITCRHGVALALKYMGVNAAGVDGGEGSRRIPIIVEAEFFAKKGTGYDRENDNYIILSCLAFVSSRGFLWTGHERRWLEEYATKFLSAELANNVMRNAELIRLGVEVDKIKAVYEGLKREMGGEEKIKYEKRTVGSSGRMTIMKRWDDFVKITDKLYMMNLIDECKVTTFQKSFMNKCSRELTRRKDKYLDLRVARWEDFIRNIMRSHIAIFASKYEGAAIAMIESVIAGGLAGTPVLFRDEEWSRFIVGEDYRWLWKDVDEAVAMAEEIFSNYSEAQEYMKRIGEEVASRHDIKDTMRAIYRIVDEEVNKKSNKAVVLKDIMLDILSMYDEMGVDEIDCDELYEKLRDRLVNRGARIFTKQNMRDWVIKNTNWYDKCDDPFKITLKRKGKQTIYVGRGEGRYVGV